jgi:ABC-type uncharacterized transport system involved in gliding motility auxiliary subunit
LVPFILIAAGAILVLAWLLTHRSLVAEVAGLRSTQDNANFLVAATAFAVILILINVVAVRFDQKFDLTEEGFYTLSPQSVEVVQELSQPVKVWVVTENPNPTIREQLERFQRLNPQQFSFEFLNPRNNPAEASRLEVKRADTIVVESGTRRQQFAEPAQLESELTPAILRTVTTDDLKAYFTEGHQELALSPPAGQTGISQASSGLSREGFTTETLNLVTTEIPEDASVIVVAGPQRPFLPGETDKLTSYLDEGGKLLLMLNPQTDTNLSPLLQEWGVELGDDVVVDRLSETFFRSGPLVALGATYDAAHPITADLANQRLFTLFPLARSVSTTPLQGIIPTQLVTTSPQGSWGETSLDLTRPNQQQTLSFDPEVDTPGPVGLGVALSKEITTPEDELVEARLVVYGSSGFASDGVYAQQGNPDLFLNTVNWLAEQEEERISIRPKSATNRRFTLNNRSFTALSWIAVLILPGLALIGGFYLWWQRR